MRRICLLYLGVWFYCRSLSLSLSVSLSLSDFPALPAPTALGIPFITQSGDSRLIPLQAFDSDSDTDSDSGNAGPRGLAGRPRRGACVPRAGGRRAFRPPRGIAISIAISISIAKMQAMRRAGCAWPGFNEAQTTRVGGRAAGQAMIRSHDTPVVGAHGLRMGMSERAGHPPVKHPHDRSVVHPYRRPLLAAGREFPRRPPFCWFLGLRAPASPALLAFFAIGIAIGFPRFARPDGPGNSLYHAIGRLKADSPPGFR
jgi:hypothetical protein